MEIMHRLKNNNAEVVTTEEPCFKLVNRKQQLQWFADQVYIGASIRLKFTHSTPNDSAGCLKQSFCRRSARGWCLCKMSFLRKAMTGESSPSS